ncbi:MAG: hypothetical protein KDK62_01805 [Chlamydiia bacterium]|nr:hypothetical protein [Chlamydiia bacterium]
MGIDIFFISVFFVLVLFSYINQRNIKKQVEHQGELIELAKQQTELIKNFNKAIDRYEEDLVLLKKRVSVFEK